MAGAGAIDILVTADTASAVSALGAVAAAAERDMARASKAAASAKADADRFTASIQRQIDTFGMSGTQLLAYEARLKGVSAQAQPLIDRLDQMRQAADAFNKSKLDANGFAEAAAGADKAAHGTAGMTREVIVLAHEMSQGNFSKFGGSLLVLAEYSGAATAALGALAGAAGAFAVPLALIGALTIAYKQGAAQSEAFSKSIALTGNYAGVTATQFDDMAKAIAASTQTSISGARTALQGLISTGNIGPNLLSPAATAVVKMEAATGQSAEAIVADFAKMGDGVAKWAEEHNTSLNFITGPQFDYIKRLEEIGDKEGAEAVVLQALNAHLNTSAGYWTKLGVAASNAWDNIVGNGRPETATEKISGIDAQLKASAEQQARPVRHGAIPRSVAMLSAPEANSLADDQNRVKAEQFLDLERSLAQAQADRAAKEQIAASKAREHWNDETKGIDLVQKKLEEYRKTVVEPYKGKTDPTTGAALDVPQAEQDRVEAGIRKKYNPAGAQLDTRYQDRLQALTAEGIKLKSEADNYAQYGKAVNDSRLAVLNLEIAQGRLKGISPAQIATLQKQAGDDDQLERGNAIDKASEAYERETKAIGSAALATAMNARQTAIAKDLEELRNKGIVEGTALYIKDSAARIAARNGEYDNKMAQQLAQEEAASQVDVQKTKDEISAIGMSTLARQLQTIATKEQAQANRELLAGGNYSQVMDAMTKRVNDQTAATKELYEAQRTAEAGAKSFFQQYSEDATNAASVTKTLASTGVKDLEDTLTNLLSGGKTNFKSLIDSFLAEATRLTVVKPLLADIFGTTGTNGTGSQGILSSLGSITQRMFGFGGAATSTGVTTAVDTTEASVGSAAFSSAGIAATTEQTTALTASAAALSTQTAAVSTAVAAYAAQDTAMTTASAALFDITSSAYAAAAALATVGDGSSVGGLFGSVAGIFGGGGGAAAAESGGVGDSLLTAGEFFVAATGENNVPYDGAMYQLHKGEAVIPAAYNPAAGGRAPGGSESSSGGDLHIHNPVYNVGQGVSMQQVAMAVQQGNAQTMKTMLRSKRTGGPFA